jgi:glycosyltransferase involved in cell wall biosynthesis
MRFLYLNHNMRGSGTYLRAFHLAAQAVQRGHSVLLVTTSRRNRLNFRRDIEAGVEILEAPDLFFGRGRTGWDPVNALRRIRMLRNRAFDVIHAFDSRPVVIHPALAVRRSANALLVMDWADWWGRGGWIQDRSGWAVRTVFGPIETWYEEAFRSRADGLTVISRALGKRAEDLGIPSERIRRVPHGCVAAEIASTGSDRARERLGISASAPLILHVGVLTPGDLKFLLAAFGVVQRELPNAALALAGRTGMTIEPASLPAGVRMTGAIDAPILADWLAAADCAVVPCRDTLGNRGRWPSKVNDYLAAGCAVVMPHVGDVAELITRERLGWTTGADVESFARGIAAALRDRDAARGAGDRARTIAAGPMSWAVLADQVFSFYNELAARRPVVAS